LSLTPVSIVLPTFNGADTLPDVFAAIEAQQYEAPVEVIAIDSGSTDGTRELLRRRAARVIGLDRHDFDHGETRNRGMAAASYPYVVLLVQDAVPAGRDWLARLVAPLDADPCLAATWARQLPRADADPVTRLALSRWTGTSPTSRVSALKDPQELDTLAPLERMERCTLDNVCACLRRSVWERHPFARAPIAEDVEWARDVLLAGYRIAFVADAEVVHSHDRSARYEYLRTRLIHRRLRTLFGLATIPDRRALATAVLVTLRAHLASVAADRSMRGRPRAWWRAVALAFAWPIGQYVGARQADKTAVRHRPEGGAP
jgi:rhamnosyltransferase